MSIYLYHKYIEMREIMKLKYFLLLILIVLVGCNDVKVNDVSNSAGDADSMNHSGWDINGYIVDTKENSKKLIVWGVEKDEIEKSNVEEIIKKADPNAMWISTKDLSNSTSLKKGDKVFVWVDQVDSSFPSSGKATRIELDQ